jgi:hypothetical protein
MWVLRHSWIIGYDVVNETPKTRTLVTEYGPEPFISISQSCWRAPAKRWSIERMGQRKTWEIGRQDAPKPKKNFQSLTSCCLNTYYG